MGWKIAYHHLLHKEIEKERWSKHKQKKEFEPSFPLLHAINKNLIQYK